MHKTEIGRALCTRRSSDLGLVHKRKFVPFPHSEGETLGFNDGAGGCGQGLAYGVGLAGLIRHEETVLDAIKVGFEFCRAVVGGAKDSSFADSCAGVTEP